MTPRVRTQIQQRFSIKEHWWSPCDIININIISRRNWSTYENKTAMECYILGFLSDGGYRKPAFI